MVVKESADIKVVGVNVKPVVETGRRAWWAYLGALGLAQDEIVKWAKRLVDRGTITEDEGRKLINGLLAWPQKGFKNVEAELQRQIEVVLERLGVLTRADLEGMSLPTRADIQALSEKVAALTKKVDQLRKQEESQAAQAEKTEALTAKVQTVNRKVTELKKTVEAAPAEAKKNSAEAVAEAKK